MTTGKKEVETMATKRILLAEDNPEDRIPPARFLRKEGFDVDEVMNPFQAKEALGENKYDAIVLDLIMPERNPDGGEEVLRFMKENGLVTPVVLATAYGYNGPARRAKGNFTDLVKEILTKPFSPKELLEAINRCLK